MREPVRWWRGLNVWEKRVVWSFIRSRRRDLGTDILVEGCGGGEGGLGWMVENVGEVDGALVVSPVGDFEMTFSGQID